jgi:hypothetical protein
MGAHYPNATGDGDGLDEPESGSHLIMAPGYTRGTGDKSLIARYIRPPTTRFSRTLLSCVQVARSMDPVRAWFQGPQPRTRRLTPRSFPKIS